MMKKTICWILPFVAGVAWAEPAPLSLDAAIGEAMEHSPELRKAELAENAASWRRLEALSGHLPQIRIEGNQIFDTKYAVLHVQFGPGSPIVFPAGVPQTTVDLAASLNVFDGLATINRYRAAIYAHDAAELDLKHQRFLLGEAVRVKFYQALAAQNLSAVADQNIKTLNDHLSLVRASINAGMSTRFDVLRIESQLEEALADKVAADDNTTIARSALNETLGIESDNRALSGELPLPGPDRVPTGLKLELERRDDVQAQLRREQASDRANAASAGFWAPAVSLFAQGTAYRYGDFSSQILATSNFEYAYTIGMHLTWNLFDGGASIARKAQASDAAQIAAEDSRKLVIHSPNDFDAWKRRYGYNTNLFRARQRAVDKSAESVRLATLGVKAGTKTNTEVLDAELDLFRARAGVIRAQVDAAEALSNLELALGHSL